MKNEERVGSCDLRPFNLLWKSVVGIGIDIRPENVGRYFPPSEPSNGSNHAVRDLARSVGHRANINLRARQAMTEGRTNRRALTAGVLVDPFTKRHGSEDT